MDRVLISLHKNYTDYAEFTKNLKKEWGKFFTTLDAFIASLRGDDILRQLTFKFLADYLLKGNWKEVKPSPTSPSEA